MPTIAVVVALVPGTWSRAVVITRIRGVDSDTGGQATFEERLDLVSGLFQDLVQVALLDDTSCDHDDEVVCQPVHLGQVVGDPRARVPSLARPVASCSIDAAASGSRELVGSSKST